MLLKETCKAWAGWIGPPPFFHFLCNGGGREMWWRPEMNTCHVWCQMNLQYIQSNGGRNVASASLTAVGSF
jgi:hypothetical protein